MKIYTDGSGKGRWAYVTESGSVRVEESETGLEVSPNYAEYKGVLLALTDLCSGKLKISDIDVDSGESQEELVLEFLLDSLIVVNQLNFEYAIRVDTMRTLATEIWEKVRILKECKKIRTVIFTWIPRRENKAGKVLG